MGIIIYDVIKVQPQLKQSVGAISNRYAELKKLMERQIYSTQEITKLQSLLVKANQQLAELSPERILEILKQNSTDILSTALETNAINTSNLISKNNYFFEFARSYDNSVGKILQLAEFANRQDGVKIKTSEFNTALLSSQKIKGQVGKAANALGEIGAIAGDIKISQVCEELLQNNLNDHKTISVPTGTQKANGQTITTDNVVLIIDSNGKLVANINISNKFNTAYRAKSKGTTNAVKMATRTVSSFLKEAKSNKSDYETALFNFLSYHEGISNGHFKRFDLLQIDNYKKDWQEVRRAISAEMLYGMTQGTGGNIQVNGYNIKDEIHLYAYGDKLFLHQDIINSAFGGRRKIPPATINLSRRASWFINRNWQSKPKPQIITGKEEEVENQIRKFVITYNQKINF